MPPLPSEKFRMPPLPMEQQPIYEGQWVQPERLLQPHVGSTSVREPAYGAPPLPPLPEIPLSLCQTRRMVNAAADVWNYSVFIPGGLVH